MSVWAIVLFVVAGGCFGFVMACLLGARQAASRDRLLRQALLRALDAEEERDENAAIISNLTRSLAHAIGHPSVRVPDFPPAEWT